MQVTLGTTTGGFAALSAQQVEGAWSHGSRGLELAQEPTEGGEGSPELLTLARQVGAQSVLHNIVTDTDRKRKIMLLRRNSREPFPPLAYRPSAARITPPSQVSESQIDIIDIN